MQKFLLGAYWGSRPEDLTVCVENVTRFFAGLAEIDPLLAQWYDTGRSRKGVLERKIDVADAQEIRRLLLKGRNRRDVDREIIEELGYHIRFWNGATLDEALAFVDIECAAYSAWVGNCVVIDLPYHTDESPWIANASRLLALAAEIWRPQWAGIMSKKAILERSLDIDEPFVDWMVYVPRQIGSVPPPGRVEATSVGSIVVVQPHPPVGDSVEELARIQRVEKLLAR